jgi:hypothetical protein
METIGLRNAQTYKIFMTYCSFRILFRICSVDVLCCFRIVSLLFPHFCVCVSLFCGSLFVYIVCYVFCICPSVFCIVSAFRPYVFRIFSVYFRSCFALVPYFTSFRIFVLYLKATPLPPAPFQIQQLSSSEDQRIDALLRLVKPIFVSSVASQRVAGSVIADGTLALFASQKDASTRQGPQLVGWLAGWLVGWLVGWLAGWLVG